MFDKFEPKPDRWDRVIRFVLDFVAARSGDRAWRWFRDRW